MARAEISVAVEATVHRAVREFAEKLLRDHGVRIDEIDLTWIDLPTVADPSGAIVGDVRLLTTTKG